VEEKLKLLTSQLGESRVKQDVDLSEYLQTKLKHRARAFYIATTTRELTRVLELCQELKIPFTIFGSGSKSTAFGQDIKGLVVKNRSSSLKVFGIKGKVTREGIGLDEALLEVDSGVSLMKLVEFAAQQGLKGFESVKGMVGTIGGSFQISPILREKATQIKIWTKEGQKIIAPDQLFRENIIFSIIFKLKARK